MNRYCIAIILFCSMIAHRADSAANDALECNARSQVKTLRDLAQEVIFNDEHLLRTVKTDLATTRPDEQSPWEMLCTKNVKEIAASLYLVSINSPKVNVLNHYPINCMAIRKNGDVVVGDENGMIRVFDDETYAQKAHLSPNYSNSIQGLALANNGDIVIASNSNVQVLDGSSYQQKNSCYASELYALTVAGEDCVVAAGGYDIMPNVYVWDGISDKAKAVLKGHEKRINCLAIGKKREIISGSDDKTVRIWDGETYTCRQVLEGHRSAVTSLAIKKDGSIVSGSSDSTIRVWDATTYACKAVLGYLYGDSPCSFWSLAVRDNGDIVSGSNGVEVWDGSTYQCKARLKTHGGVGDSSLALDRRGNIISGASNRVQIWDEDSLLPNKLQALSDTQIVKAAVLLKAKALENERLAGDGVLSEGQCAAVWLAITGKMPTKHYIYEYKE